MAEDSAGVGNQVLSDDRVRVRYSVIVNYLSRIYRLFTAIVFAIVVTRKLGVDEYGLFTTIMGLVAVLTTMYDVWCYWVPRFYARNRPSLVSTAFMLNLICLPITVVLMVLLGLYYNSILGWGFVFFLPGVMLITIDSVIKYLRGVVVGTKPFVEGKTVVLQETIRVLSAYMLVALLATGLLGALASVCIAALVKSIAYYVLLKHYGVKILKPRLSLVDAKKLMANSYIPALSTFSQLLRQSERPLVTAITGSTLPAAFLGVAYVPRSIIAEGSMAFTSSIFAKLLRKPSRTDVEDVLRISIVVNVGVLFILLFMSRSILSLFKAAYVGGAILFYLLALEAFTTVFTGIFSTIAVGIEKKDLYESGLALKSTPLFRINLARFLGNTTVIAVGSLASAILATAGIDDPVFLVLPYPVAWLATSIALLVYTYFEAQKKILFTIPWRELYASIISGIFSILYLYFSRVHEIIVESIWVDLPRLVIHGATAMIIYVGLLYVFSPWVRTFVKTGLNYVKTLVVKKL